MAITPRTGAWNGESEPFTLNVQQASLQWTDELAIPGNVRDLDRWQDDLVVAGSRGITVVEPGTLQVAGQLTSPRTVAARAVTRCGAYLCVARMGLRGLTVVSLSEPAHPSVTASLFTLGVGWDVAAVGSRVYVAHGIFGVGVYLMDQQGQPSHQETIWTGGLVRSVASHGELLAVAHRRDAVRLGSITENAAETSGMVWLGTVGYTLAGNGVVAYEVQALQP